jgi:hypothetical protein
MEDALSAYENAVEKTIDRLELCTLAVLEIHGNLVDPVSAEQRADLVLTTEELAVEIAQLLHTVREMVWGPDKKKDGQPSEED